MHKTQLCTGGTPGHELQCCHREVWANVHHHAAYCIACPTVLLTCKCSVCQLTHLLGAAKTATVYAVCINYYQESYQPAHAADINHQPMQNLVREAASASASRDLQGMQICTSCARINAGLANRSRAIAAVQVEMTLVIDTPTV